MSTDATLDTDVAVEGLPVWPQILEDRSKLSIRELSAKYEVPAGAIAAGLRRAGAMRKRLVRREDVPKTKVAHEPEPEPAVETSRAKTASAPRQGQDKKRTPRPSKIDPFRDLVGRVSDSEVGRRAGVTSQAVVQYRRKHGIPAYSKRSSASMAPEAPGTKKGRRRKKRTGRSKIDPYASLLGTCPDPGIAELAGVTPSAVTMYRRRRGIPAFDPKSPSKAKNKRRGQQSKIDPFRHLLGTMPDERIGKLAGVGRRAVLAYRRKQGISAYTAGSPKEAAVVVTEAPRSATEKAEKAPSTEKKVWLVTLRNSEEERQAYAVGADAGEAGATAVRGAPEGLRVVRLELAGRLLG